MMDEVVAAAHRLVKQKKRSAAMSLANQAITQYPDEMEAWLLRGHLNELFGNYVVAATDLTLAIGLNSREPHLYYSRGRYYFQLSDLHSAVNEVNDFTKALELCDDYNSDYYREELHFWRAEAQLKLGNWDAALKDIKNLRLYLMELCSANKARLAGGLPSLDRLEVGLRMCFDRNRAAQLKLSPVTKQGVFITLGGPRAAGLACGPLCSSDAIFGYRILVEFDTQAWFVGDG